MRKSGKTQPCGKRAPGRELHLKESSKRLPGQRPGWEERRGGMVCGKHDSTVLGVRSGHGVKGCGVKGCFTWWLTTADAPTPPRLPEHRSKRSNTLPFPWCFLHLPGALCLEHLVPQCTAFLGEQGSQNHRQGFGSTVVTPQGWAPPAQGGSVDDAAVPKGNTLLVEQASTFTPSHMCTLFV